MSLRGILILLCVPASAFAAYYGQPLVGHNSDAIVVLTHLIHRIRLLSVNSA
jgi:hypothetical protein